MAAKKAAISISCFFLNKCGIQIGSAAINKGWLNSATFISKKLLSSGSFTMRDNLLMGKFINYLQKWITIKLRR